MGKIPTFCYNVIVILLCHVTYNMHYKRFRHFGKDKVTMDFAFFATAFNIKKMIATMKRAA